jgi:hypothetical protein
MTPERFHHIFPEIAPSAVQVQSRANRYGGAWIVFCPELQAQSGNKDRVITQFAAWDAFGATRWLARHAALCDQVTLDSDDANL